MTPATEPNTRAPAAPAVAFVATPFKFRQAAPSRGCTLIDADGGLHNLTANAIAVIDFYPAPNHQGATRDR